MVRTARENILLIDGQRQLEAALSQAMPSAHVVTVSTWFDAIVHLAEHSCSAVFAPAEPVEKRAESAIEALRGMAGEARLIVFGQPSLEPLSRRMVALGCDDYLITPGRPDEIKRMLGSPLMRIAPADASEQARELPKLDHPALNGLALVDLLTRVLCEHPHDPTTHLLRQLNERLGPSLRVSLVPTGTEAPAAVRSLLLSASVGAQKSHQVHLLVGPEHDANDARQLLSGLAELLGRVLVMQDRHNSLQKLAITDELTGLYNARYFRHFLAKIIEYAKQRRFPVTLFIFDIDNFKKYNDQFGHPIGDEILKQTASLMRRCCREHDLVARIGGDEFAVVFWEKEGPREPKGGGRPRIATRWPQDPLDILSRFQELMATQHFDFLGPAGKGTLTISGGLAVYPYDARSLEELIVAADQQLMQRAKRAGKNSIFLVGSEEKMGAKPPPQAGERA